MQRWRIEERKLPMVEQKRARHVITEHERTLAFVEALKIADWRIAGTAMYGSHESLRRDYQVSCAELDTLVEISRHIPGVHGCRMTGGGFGGCVVALIEARHADSVMRAFEQQYQKATGIHAAMFITRAADGPQVRPLERP